MKCRGSPETCFPKVWRRSEPSLGGKRPFEVSKKIFFVEKWNVGNRPKRVLAKFGADRSHVSGVNGRLKHTVACYAWSGLLCLIKHENLGNQAWVCLIRHTDPGWSCWGCCWSCCCFCCCFCFMHYVNIGGRFAPLYKYMLRFLKIMCCQKHPRYYYVPGSPKGPVWSLKSLRKSPGTH